MTLTSNVECQGHRSMSLNDDISQIVCHRQLTLDMHTNIIKREKQNVTFTFTLRS